MERILVVALMGCGSPGATGTPPGALTTGSASSGTSSGTPWVYATPADSGGWTIGGQFDCSRMPDGPGATREVPSARGFHGLAFDAQGRMVGVGGGQSDSDLVAVDSAGNLEILAADVGRLEQIIALPDGRLVAPQTESGGIIAIDASGTVSMLTPGVGAYGLVLGPDERIWAADWSSVRRVDPATGASQVVLASVNGGPKVLAFNPRGDRLYIGTVGGVLYQVELDGNHDPIGSLSTLATGVGDVHDGLAVDACGYLYLADFSTTSVFRISPSGEAVQLQNYPLVKYGHGVLFGTGRDGWADTSIFQPQPYGGSTVVELPVGVPSAAWPGEIVNPPAGF